MASVPIVVGSAATRSGCPCALSDKRSDSEPSPLATRGLVPPRPSLEEWLKEKNRSRGWRFMCGEVEEEVYEGSSPSPSSSLRLGHRRCRHIPPQVATCRFGGTGAIPWEATVSLKYYQVGTQLNGDDKDENVTEDKVVVVTLGEVAATIRWEAASYSQRDRTVTCRIPLDAQMMPRENWDELVVKEHMAATATIMATRPPLQAVVSSDGRFLSCLLPHMEQQKTTVLQWTLKKQRRDAANSNFKAPPPLPSYLMQTRASPPSSPAAAAAAGLRRSLSSGSTSKMDELPQDGVALPPVPTQPQVVFLPVHEEEENEPCISCLCPAAVTTTTLSSATSANTTSNSNSSKRAPVCILLAGCTDGSILSIRYHRRRPEVPNVDVRSLVSLLLAPTTAAATTALSDHAILQISFCPTERHLAVVRQDGVVSVYSATATATGESGLFLEEDEEEDDENDDDDENEGLDNGNEGDDDDDSTTEDDHGSNLSTPTAMRDTLSVSGASPASTSAASPSVLFRRKMAAFSPQQHLRPRRLLAGSSGSPSLPFPSGSTARNAAGAIMTRVLPPVPTGRGGGVRGTSEGPPPPPPASPPPLPTTPFFLRRSGSGASNSSHGRSRRASSSSAATNANNTDSGIAHLFLHLRFLLTLDSRRRRRLRLRQHVIIPASPSSGGSLTSVSHNTGTVTTPRFVHGQWIAPHTLLLLTRRNRSSSAQSPTEDENVIAQVWSITSHAKDKGKEEGQEDDLSSPRCRSAASVHRTFDGHVLATLRIMADDLLQKDDVGTFSMPSLDSDGAAPAASFAHADGFSDTVSIVSAVVSKRRRREKGEAAYTLRPFVCLWNWRSDVTGFTLVAADDSGDAAGDDDDKQQPRDGEEEETGAKANSTSTPLSTLTWSHRRDGARCLVHTHLAPYHRLQKHVFEVAVLSPLSCGTRHYLEESTPLLLTCRSVQFPIVSMPTENEDQTVKWSESIIPPNYTSCHGPATLAAMGRRNGRSIAVASSRGLCLLDMSRLAATASLSSSSASKAVGARPSPCVTGTKCVGGDSGNGASESKIATAATALSNSIHELSGAAKPVASSSVGGGLRNRVSKWRLFATEAEERSFRVVSMAWWERSLEDEEESSEDLLLAVVHYVRGGRLWLEDDHADQLYLVCWSRRRLGMGQDQLLVDSMSAGDSPADRRRGIALPRLMEPGCALSILADPTSSERALGMISCANSSGGISYMIYQVEADASNKNQLRVLARLSSAGRYLTTNASNTNGTSFLAGGSFAFRLRQSTENGIDSDEIVATLAISRGDGLDAVAVTPAGPLVAGKVVGGFEDDDEQAPPQLVSFWLSDATSPTTPEAASSLVAHCFVWSLHWTDGNVYAWSVPYVASDGGGGVGGSGGGTINSRRNSSTGFAALHSSFQGLLLPPQPVSPLPIPGVESRNIVLLRRDVLGSCSLLGESSSTLINGASTIEGDIGLGALPASNFGCVMYAGQRSWHTKRRVPLPAGGVGRGPEFVTLEMHTLGEGVVSSPAFTSSLFVSALTAAAETCLLGTTATSRRRASKPSVGALVSRSHAKHMLLTRFNSDAVIMALRVLCLRTVELLSSVIESGLQDSSRYGPNEGKLLGSFADALLREVVWIADVGLSPLQFVALFLSIGRQMEPHHFHYLFPLPPTAAIEVAPLPSLHRQRRRVEDLFAAAVECGSVSIAASALPLFSCKEEAHRECCRLLRHCLRVVHEQMLRDDVGEEAAAVLAQLYRYGLKLEEAEAAERGQREEAAAAAAAAAATATSVVEAATPPPAPSSAPTPLTNANGVDEEESEASASKSNVSVGTIAKLLSPSTWGTTSNKAKALELDENAIRMAASSFILSGFEEHYTLDESNSGVESRQHARLEGLDDNDEWEPAEAQESKTQERRVQPLEATRVATSAVVDTVGGILGAYLAFLVFELDNGWRYAGRVAQIIGTEGLLRSTEADTKQVFDVLTSLEEDDVAGVLVGNNNLTSEGEKSDVILDALLQQMTECERQLQGGNGSNLLFPLLLSVMKACRPCHDFLAHKARLVAQWAVMWVVVGRIDGSLDFVLLGGGSATFSEEEFLEAWESSPLGRAHVEILQRNQRL